MMHEIDRVRQRYERRKRLPSERYSYFAPGNLFMVQERERLVLSILRTYKMTRLETQKILEVGCGTGAWLLNFIRWGARPNLVFGVELLEDRIREARARLPFPTVVQANAEHIPFRDGCFDIVLCATVLSSIHDEQVRRHIVSEMVRVVKDGGLILVYALRFNNPWNPDVLRVGRKQLRQLFGQLSIELHPVTLAPPLVRRMAPFSWLLCEMLSKIPCLRTHYLTIVRKSQTWESP